MDEYSSYDGIVGSWGYTVALVETFGSYQGDIAFLLRDGTSWGWIVIGYGSCSGCDSLEAMSQYDYNSPGFNLTEESKAEIAQFSESLKDSVVWRSTEEMVAWLADEEIQQGKYSWYEAGFPEFLAKARQHVQEAS